MLLHLRWHSGFLLVQYFDELNCLYLHILCNGPIIMNPMLQVKVAVFTSKSSS